MPDIGETLIDKSSVRGSISEELPELLAEPEVKRPDGRDNAPPAADLENICDKVSEYRVADAAPRRVQRIDENKRRFHARPIFQDFTDRMRNA
jgi:hypothetical protein